MADAGQALSATQALTILALGGLLGMIGQGARAVVGLKKMNDEAQSSTLSSADLFSASRLVVSLMIGFVAGVIATISLGMEKLTNFSGGVSLLMGIAAAGYVGSDFIEAFAPTLDKTQPPPIPGDFDRPPIPAPERPPAAKPQPAPVAPSNAQTIVGRMSEFGGPDDKGMQADEGLALMDESDMAKYPDLFLAQQPPGTTGLGRRLNPAAAYIACRWKYDETPKNYLKRIQVKVRNPTTGAVAQAQPVDWGPAASTGRIADLSPGLAQQLGLVTDQICAIELPLPMEDGNDPKPEVVSRHLRVMTLDEIGKNFGAFDFQDVPPRGAIRINGTWPAENIVTVEIAELSQFVPDGKVECHKAIAAPLQAAFKEIANRNLLDRIIRFDGLWVPRHKTWNPTRTLSPHSWGVAFDINARWNGYGADPAPKGATGSVVELVPIFESFGFAWGGYFRPDGARDGMHFEYCRATAPAPIIVA